MSRCWPILLLVVSNVFMTYAWYGHLRNGARNAPIGYAILLSWGVAFFEYCFMVPANRLGRAGGYSFAQLKTIQEIVTLTVFVGFMVVYFKERPAWNHLVGFALIAAAGFFVFGFAPPRDAPPVPAADRAGTPPEAPPSPGSAPCPSIPTNASTPNAPAAGDSPPASP